MKNQTPCNARLARLGESIEIASVVMLSSLDADGVLITRPMKPLHLDGDGGLWFFTDQQSARIANFCVAIVSFVEPTRGTYVSLPGHSEIDTDRARSEKLRPQFVGPAVGVGSDAANLALLKFVPDPAEEWDAPRSAVVELFAVTGQHGVKNSRATLRPSLRSVGAAE